MITFVKTDKAMGVSVSMFTFVKTYKALGVCGLAVRRRQADAWDSAASKKPSKPYIPTVLLSSRSQIRRKQKNHLKMRVTLGIICYFKLYPRRVGTVTMPPCHWLGILESNSDLLVAIGESDAALDRRPES